MKNKQFFVDEARFLFEHSGTVWDNYDMCERSYDPEKRVPKLEFDDLLAGNVEMMLDEVHYYRDCPISLYVREIQVLYNDQVYIFEISTKMIQKRVHGFNLEVYVPAGDGKGGKYWLFSQKI